ncbi:MAG: Fic family protein [Candidatus Niyogibacteria bacterium]|nr:Fic family protein [Candidatus Niyogibacteria bacterium]
MTALLNRPKDEKERQLCDAVGAIRAARFVRRYAKTNKPINLDAVLAIQREIFKDWWPEIAGKLRQEEVKLWHSKHRPPHFSRVPTYMFQFERWLIEKLSSIDSTSLLSKDRKISVEEFVKIIGIAAEAHHEISWIHPFRDGNGRTARLLANLIFQRYGLWGISSQIERENKEEYLKALSQIDDFDDYEPLMNMMADGLVERAQKEPGFKPFNRG